MKFWLNQSSEHPVLISLCSFSHHRTMLMQTQTLVLFSNIQSKIIKDSQTSTVKIQHHFRYRGPLLENGVSPSRMYMFFFFLQYSYAWSITIYTNSTLVVRPGSGEYLQNSLPHLDYRLMQPIAEKNANLPFKFVFVILPFQLSLGCKAIPAVPSRLRQTQSNINANTV